MNKIIYIIIALILLPACQKQPRATQPEKKLVVLIPSYNNEKWCIKNLKSVFAQRYNNYHVTYIDDHSSDKTFEKVVDYVARKKQTDRITIIKNKKRVGALANIYHAVHTCDDNEIIVQLDGDDWFAHKHVLQKINQLYSTKNIWVTYGQFKNWPTGNIGYCKPIPQEIVDTHNFRKFGHVAGAIRTFYAWLFKRINKQDLLDADGFFYQSASDVAYMFPLLEMAGDRFCFVQEILCTRNVKTDMNDFKIHKPLQERITRGIEEKNPYKIIYKGNPSTAPPYAGSAQDERKRDS